MVCSVCGSEISEGARFCSACGRAITPEPYGTAYSQSVHSQSVQGEAAKIFDTARAYVTPSSRLIRPRQGRMIAGVCMGFARAYGWDVVVVRLVLCLALVFGAGIPLIAYLIAWVVMPEEPHLLPSMTGSTGTPPQSPPVS